MQKLINTCFFLLASSAVGLQLTTPADDEYNKEDEEVKRSSFPRDFIFGAATSAYQIEGGYLEDGKGLNNWDVFTRLPGNIKNGDNGDVADDHYHRYMEDIEIMQSLGLNAYRFSISWARILPRGKRGHGNQKGIQFYNKIIDNLLLKGIEPFVTINHHDIPHELETRYGGWLSPLIHEDFVEYARICFDAFGDRVKYWMTINEPNLFVGMAYREGRYPPNHCSPPFGNCSLGNSDTEPLLALHNMLLSHAKATRLYRTEFQAKQGGHIGIVVHSHMYEPYHDTEIDRVAVARILAINAPWVLDPLIYGDYPPEMRQYHGKELPRFSKEEKMLVKGSLDFIGLNHYSTLFATDCLHSPCSSPTNNRPIRGFVGVSGERHGFPIGELTGMPSFYVVPRGMEKIIDYMSMRYPSLPIIVTENGYASSEQDDEQELLHDFKRISFHKAYLASLARAIRKGANVKGYFIWSLIDNFEWIYGYSVRFGIYYVDRTTLNRYPKLSATWYVNFLGNQTSTNFRAPNSLKDKFIVSASDSSEKKVVM